MYDVQSIRNDFPILGSTVNNHPLVYFDNAATTQKPQAVIDAIVEAYSRTNSNIHRGIHTLSQISTTQYEQARKTVQTFINAPSDREIIFTKGYRVAEPCGTNIWRSISARRRRSDSVSNGTPFQLGSVADCVRAPQSHIAVYPVQQSGRARCGSI